MKPRVKRQLDRMVRIAAANVMNSKISITHGMFVKDIERALDHPERECQFQIVDFRPGVSIASLPFCGPAFLIDKANKKDREVVRHLHKHGYAWLVAKTTDHQDVYCTIGEDGKPRSEKRCAKLVAAIVETLEVAGAEVDAAVTSFEAVLDGVTKKLESFAANESKEPAE